MSNLLSNQVILITGGLSVLANEKLITPKHAEDAIKKYNIDKNKPMPTKL